MNELLLNVNFSGSCDDFLLQGENDSKQSIMAFCVNGALVNPF